MDSRHGDKIQYLEKRLESLENELQRLRTNKSETFNIHEKDKTEVDKKVQNYAESLTVHGLSRIATGSTISKLVWSILVVTSFSIGVWISKEHWISFLRHDVKTHTTMRAEHEMPFPAITICNATAVERERKRFVEGEPIADRPILVHYKQIYEKNYTRNGTAPLVAIGYRSSDYSHLEDRIHSEFIIDNQTNCFTIRGETHKTMSEKLFIEIIIDRTLDRWTEIHIAQQNEPYPMTSSTIYSVTDGYYHGVVTKKIITRVGQPYSECVKKNGTYSQNKFEGNYTIKKCKKGCLLEKVYQKCGAIPRMYKSHMREPDKFENKTTINETFSKECMNALEHDHSATKECNNVCHMQPCSEEDFKLSLHYNTLELPNTLMLSFSYESFLVEILEEKPDHTWQDLFANFGGCVGLMTGASILSIVELLFFVGLVAFDLIKKYTKIHPKNI